MTDLSSPTGASGLVYSLMPATAAVSSSGTTNVVTFTLTITAPQSGPVSGCSKLEIDIPTTLSPANALAPVPTSSSAAWVVVAKNANMITGRSSPPSTITPGVPLTITLASVSIADTLGTPSITVKLTTGTGTDVVTLPVQLYQPDFSVKSFSISPAVVNPRDEVTLSWSVEGEASCTLYSASHPDGLSQGGDSYTDQPAVSTTYTLEWTSNGSTVTQQLTAVVEDLAILTFEQWLAAPTSGLAAGSATLRWQTQKATYVILDPGRIQLPPANLPGQPALATVSYVDEGHVSIDTNPTADDQPVITVPYSDGSLQLWLSAVDDSQSPGGGGNVVQETMLLPVPPVTASLTASAASDGKSATFAWTVNGATSATLDCGLGQGPQSLTLQPGKAQNSGTQTVATEPGTILNGTLTAIEGSQRAQSSAAVTTGSGIAFTNAEWNEGWGDPPIYLVLTVDSTLTLLFLLGQTVHLMDAAGNMFATAYVTVPPPPGYLTVSGLPYTQDVPTSGTIIYGS